MAQKAPSSLVGVVVRAGTMDKVVKVQRAKQKFDSFLQKYFVLHPSYLITDPRNSTRAGDVVRFARWPYARGSPRVQHIVTEIVSAFGPRLDERPPLPTAAEREQMVLGMEERVAEKRRARIRRKMAEQQTAEEETETKTEKVEARRPRRREGRAGREAREAEGEGRDAAARARGRGETA